MKKYLLIFLFSISVSSSAEIDYSQDIQEINISAQSINLFTQQIYDQMTELFFNLNNELEFYLYSEDYKQVLSDLVTFFAPEDEFITLPQIYSMLQSIDSYGYFIDSSLVDQYELLSNIFNSIVEMQSSDNQFYDYLYTWNLGSNVEDSKNALQSIDSHMDNLKISVNQLGDKIDQIIVNAGDSSDLLTDILNQIKSINSNTGGGVNSGLEIRAMGYFDLDEYGKDVNTADLPYYSFSTTGEYNKDVHKMLINLNHIGHSQNNALLSMLTNVQLIASSVGGTAEGEDKVEKDIQERGYKASQAQHELNAVISQNWDNSFTAPRSISDVYDNLSVSLTDVELPQRITIIENFHYESQSFTAEIDDLGFDLPQGAFDIAYYGRIVFGFIYWSLALGLAIFIFKLWIKLYFFVSQNLMNK